MRFLSSPAVRRTTELLAVVLPFATLSLAPLGSSAVIGPSNDFFDSTAECSHIIYRQEWRTLSQQHQQEYISAVKCAHTLPNKTTYRGVKSRLDDFHAVHIHTAYEIHHVGHFFPWHRRYLSLFETMLRDECGFRGALPYWDWSLDADSGASLLDSPIFDPKTGFGGDGVEGTFSYNWTSKQMDDNAIDVEFFKGCVMDGPFAHPDFTLHLGPGFLVGDHCLVRGLNASAQNNLTSSGVQEVLKMPTFETFRMALEVGHGDGAEHGAGHYAIGGDSSNLFSSPVEPIFFLHHANLDRLWWKWQSMDLSQRLTDVSGSDIHHRNVSLHYILPFGQINDKRPIIEVMDVNRYPMCYDYI